MPTQETWLDDDIYATIWQVPLTVDDLRLCFMNITEAMTHHQKPPNVLFDLTESSAIPFNAPYVALKSGFMTHHNADRVAVVGMNLRAQMLADIVVKVTKRDILFFASQAEAVDYLKVGLVKSESELEPS